MTDTKPDRYIPFKGIDGYGNARRLVAMCGGISTTRTDWRLSTVSMMSRSRTISGKARGT